MKDNTTPTLKEKKNRLDTVSDVILVRIMTFLTYKDIAALGSCSLLYSRYSQRHRVAQTMVSELGTCGPKIAFRTSESTRHIEWKPMQARGHGEKL